MKSNSSSTNPQASDLNARWSSSLIFILATAGAAIGLGNVWKFPYMIGSYGGGAFLLVYMISIFLVGIPMMMAETLLGKMGRADPVSTMKKLSKQYSQSRFWIIPAATGLICLLFILSYYSMAAGWVMAYAVKTTSGSFVGQTPQIIGNSFSSFLEQTSTLIMWHTIFIVLTVAVISFGVKKGLERAVRFIMPLLLLILIILLYYSLKNGDVSATASFLFSFKWEDMTWGVVVAAIGQSFFSLALGAGAILMYGAYAPERMSIGKTCFIVAMLDTLVALCAGLIIFPLLFAYQLEPAIGPGLLFVVLPSAFSEITHGSVMGGAFFGFIFLAAWASSINLTEPLVVYIGKKLNLNRVATCITIGVAAWLLGLLSIFSFNIGQDLTLFDKTFFDIITMLTDRILLPFGAISFTLFVAWCIPKTKVFNYAKMNSPIIIELWYKTIRYICPAAVIAIIAAWFFWGIG